MTRTRRLPRGEITYSGAKEEETNMLIALEDYGQTVKYFSHLLKQSDLICRAAAHHLGISPMECELDAFKHWLYGKFNVCIPIRIRGRKEVLMRFPILHRVGESFRPGNADEKIRCEAMHGCKKIAPQYLCLNSTDLPCQRVKVYGRG
ncbi:predicted protein [Coccidioides posadasii str. Silveira]|uniref:Predicted protein n=1 Tax=Coccidioides posadasii (strain RMSCC 757 / Silveira) TaxID=443226 RepID=E9DHC6_COCPS|nr:predicted protein [Coccidioides posadasii str. Silveira]